MSSRRLHSAWLVLVISALACGVPFSRMPDQGAQSPSAVEAAAAQTIAAQQLAATETALELGLDVTAAAFNATQTEISNQASLQAGSALATGTAQVLSLTSAAQIAQATAIAVAQTSTAQANIPPPPPPPPPILPTAQTGAVRIRFASGATSATVDGQIQQNQRVDYILRALQNQMMLTSVYSPNDNVFLGVIGQTDGISLIHTSAGSTTFTGVLPGTQDYRISLISPVQNSSYTLQVIIPSRIKFAHGAISAELNGFLLGGEVNYYLLRAMAGQTMTVNIHSPANDIFLTIYGLQDGSPLVRSVMAQTSWTGILPATQDYMIQAVSTGGSANYTLQTIVQ